MARECNGGAEGEHSAGRNRRLSLGFVLVSLTLSLVTLNFRNLFDDEIFSLPLVTGPVSAILATAREGDVHPPGMYLLGYLGWQMMHSYRWLNVLPLAVLYVGLTLFALRFVPRFGAWEPRWAALLFATLHPELLLWSNTMRWYCAWTGLALLALVLLLQPGRRTWSLSWLETAAGVVLLAAMFYLNYITLLFVVAVAVAVWVRLRRGGPSSGWVGRLAVGVVALALLIAPQVRVLWTVQWENSRAQRSEVVVSGVRLLQALMGSEAYLPWHPLAVAAGLVCFVLLVLGVVELTGKVRTKGGEAETPGDPSQVALMAFGVTFLVLVGLTGLGGKPRNAVLLVPVFAPAVGFGMARLGARSRRVAMGLLGIWAAGGVIHLTGRFGLQKANMNDRPEQVVALMRGELANAGRDCAVALSYDGGVVFSLAQARIPNLMILSPYRGGIFAGTLEAIPEWCERPRLWVVRSYRSGEPDRDWKYTTELATAETFLEGPVSVTELSRDEDAGMKRRLSRLVGLEAGASLPDYRFTVLSGAMRRDRMDALRERLPHFVSGEGVLPDGPGDGSRPGGT